MARSFSRFLVLACLAAPSAFAQNAASPRLGPLVDGLYPALEVLYKDLHEHPELAFQEKRTAGKLAEQMRALGFEVTEGVGRTGLVALYRNGAGPTVLVRTELDALPMEEKTGLPYASKAKAQWNGRETFVAHSCGHDLHMTGWVGTARALLELKNEWRGTLMFVAQPAEEIVSGAKAMIADGLFTRFPKPDLAFALHTGVGPHGFINYRAGPITSASNGLTITFKGRGGHGATPDKTIDPVALGARFVTDVQQVVSREKDPAEFGVITIGSFQAGTVGNIIPDSALLQGTIRSFKPEVRRKLVEGARRVALASAQMAGAPEPVIQIDEGASAVINDSALTQRTVAALKAQFGADKIREVSPTPASEDFSDFGDAGIPSMFFFIGTSDPQAVAEAQKGGKPIPVNHSPYFSPMPEPSIKVAVQAMVTAVLSAAGTASPRS